jgi:hypothetical protein
LPPKNQLITLPNQMKAIIMEQNKLVFNRLQSLHSQQPLLLQQQSPMFTTQATTIVTKNESKASNDEAIMAPNQHQTPDTTNMLEP